MRGVGKCGPGLRRGDGRRGDACALLAAPPTRPAAAARARGCGSAGSTAGRRRSREVVVGEVVVDRPRHRRQDLAAAAHVAAGADRVDEVLLRPLAGAGLVVGRQVGGEADAPGAGPGGVGGRASHDPRPFAASGGGGNSVSAGWPDSAAAHVGLGAVRGHLPRRVAVVAAGGANDVLAAALDARAAVSWPAERQRGDGDRHGKGWRWARGWFRRDGPDFKACSIGWAAAFASPTRAGERSFSRGLSAVRDRSDPALDERDCLRDGDLAPSGGICRARVGDATCARRAGSPRRMPATSASPRCASAGGSGAARGRARLERPRALAPGAHRVEQQRQVGERARRCRCGSGRSCRAGSRARRARSGERRRCAAGVAAAAAAGRESRARRAPQVDGAAVGGTAACGASGSRSGDSCSALRSRAPAPPPAWQARQSARRHRRSGRRALSAARRDAARRGERRHRCRLVPHGRRRRASCRRRAARCSASRSARRSSARRQRTPSTAGCRPGSSRRRDREASIGAAGRQQDPAPLAAPSVHSGYCGAASCEASRGCFLT
jgi:hypothetical protein